MLKDVSVSRKLAAQACLSILVILVMAAINLFGVRQTLTTERKASVKQATETAVSLAGYYQKQAESGAMSEADARAAAGNAIGSLRFGQGGYIYVYDSQGALVVHPRKELVGKNMSDAKDPNGVYFAREALKTAQAGGGFTAYSFTKQGQGDAVFPKISYDSWFAPWGWSIGNGVYIDDIDAAFRQEAMVLGGVLVVVVGVMLALNRTISKSIAVPLQALTGIMRELAAGNFDMRISGADRRDEIGGMAAAVEVFKANGLEMRRLAKQQDEERTAKESRARAVEDLVKQFEATAAKLAQSLSGSATELKGTAQSMSAAASQATSQATSVEAAAAQATANVETVASAAEQLTSSINEISRQVAESARISTEASEETGRTNDRVQGLATAADRIGEVVKLINDIASQTNLLALNATIEAARAGDAGKGFAVVASEVKTLASQTTRATEDIQAQVAGIQSETERAVSAIAGIGSTVTEMRSIAAGIASAMEQQGATTSEIARNIGQAADGTRSVSGNIAGVAGAAETTSHAAADLRKASDQLQREAIRLDDEMRTFFADLRAA